jgi:hypothetical protein
MKTGRMNCLPLQDSCFTVELELSAGRRIGGVVVHGLRGRDILELDGCGPCVLISCGVMLCA